MNIHDYETHGRYLYEAFAEKVRFVLGTALETANNLPVPQSIQARAKSPSSLRQRLAEAGKLETQTLELERRDLAGARLIFYTNNDVDQFLASPLIRENFAIEEDSTKIHHPTPENDGKRYRAFHYTVRLKDDRVRLPEYAKFAGLRCEIQVQTILNHAWSETSHDILYKNKLGDGYGQEAMKGISRRLNRIMDQYLIPAGFEIQKAQQEYERVMQGQELFDKNITALLSNALDNNQRYEILSGLKDYAIPNFDDLPAAYDGLKGPLLNAVKAGRESLPVPIKTTFGDMEGFNGDAITKLVVEIIDSLRYVDVIGTLQLLIDIYRDESNEDVRRQILNTVKALSEYNIDSFNHVGPMLQMALIDYLADLDNSTLDSIRAIALAIWSEALQSDITGTKWKADAVVLSRGGVPASDQLREVRAKAKRALFAAYDRSNDDTQKREVLAALDAATMTPDLSDNANGLFTDALRDAVQITEFAISRSANMSYELLQHLEHKFLYDYFRAKDLYDDPQDRFDCKTEAKTLMDAIFRFRDTINVNDQFVRYKVLVGYESVFPRHWADKEFEYNGVDEYRREEAKRYIDEITEANEIEWFEFVARCAGTKSDDLATFPIFAGFISDFAERKPDIANRFLKTASQDLRSFLVSFLNGFALNGQREIYRRILETELESATHLPALARHLRYSDVKEPEFADRLLKRSIENDASIAVIECLLFALEHYGTDKINDADVFIRDALAYLNKCKDARWVAAAWFAQKATKFFENLSPERTAQLLENLSYIQKIDFKAERILTALAVRQPEAVWDYFGVRITRQSEQGKNDDGFQAVPFRFSGLERELSKNIQLAITRSLAWFNQDRALFQFRGGRVLSSTFPNFPAEFAAALTELVMTGGEAEADYVLAVLQNYRGYASIFPVLKEILLKFPDDVRKVGIVRSCLDSTGVVYGESGMAEAWRAKKGLLADWLNGEQTTIKSFAEKHIAELDKMIASEMRSTEAEREMHIRSFDEDE